MRKIYIVILCLAVLSATGCKKKYVSPLEEPITTLAPEDKPYVLDFDQMNNDVIDALQEKQVFGFLKDIDVTGDNDNKEIVLNADITDNVSTDAIDLFMTEATKAIADAASTQDFRITSYNDEDFGNLFEKYTFKYKITCGEEVIADETIGIGDSVPFDPTLTIENVIG